MLDGEVTLHEALAGTAPLVATALKAFSPLSALTKPLGGRLMIAESATAEAAMLMRSGLATVVLQKTLDDFRAADGHDLLRILSELATAEHAESKSRRAANFRDGLASAKITGMEAFAAVFENNYAEVDESQLESDDLEALEALRAMSEACAGAMGRGFRPVRAGNSMTKRCWTDGATIWLTHDRLTATTPEALLEQCLAVTDAYCADSLNTGTADPTNEESARFGAACRSEEAPAAALRAAMAVVEATARRKHRPMPVSIQLLAAHEDTCAKAREGKAA